MNIDFQNTEIAFGRRNAWELKRAYYLFRLLKAPGLVDWLSIIAQVLLKIRFPIQWIIKRTVFAQFCGGESINESRHVIASLSKENIGTILDFAAEGSESEQVLDQNAEEVLRTVKLCAGTKDVPFCVFKPTGVFRPSLLEVSHGKFSPAQAAEWKRGLDRAKRICQLARECQVSVFIDAEESWLLANTDLFAEQLMREFNKTQVTVFHTVQMYLKDRLEYLAQATQRARDGGYRVGWKIVRGAYLEKERARAVLMKYPSPICDDKSHTDANFDSAVKLCLNNLDISRLCSGTHNELSCMQLVRLMEENQIEPKNPSVYFAQLYGMSDHISVNLAQAGYNVAKYVPYGPVRTLMPYLSRRAKENTSVAGHSGRELELLERERKRRQLK